MRALIGVDIGTQGSKGALVSETGQILATCSIEQEMTIPRPGWAEHDADGVWWPDFVAIIRELLRCSHVTPDQISAVGLSGLMPVLVPVDGDGRAVRPAISYADTRAHAEMTAMNVDVTAAGQPPLVAHDVGPKMVWFRDHEPAHWARTRVVLGAQGHVIAKLTGRDTIDVFTASGMRPFFDLTTRGWDVLACERYGVPVSMLPEIVEMTEVAGTVTAEAAAATGLAPGTPVIGGATDFLAEVLSTGANQPGDVVVSYGTTLCFAAFSRQLVELPQTGGSMLREGSDLARLYPGLTAVGAGSATSGALTRWFRDQFGQGEKRAEADLGISAYSLLALEAEATPPGADGLVVLPYFSGERSPLFDDRARGVIFGLTLAHGRGHLYRALLEGVAYGLQHQLELIREQGAPVCRLVATGGGSRSALWTQIVSDVTRLPQTVIVPSNAALGAAFLAGYAEGIFRQVDDVRQWARPGREVQPRDEIHAVYQRLYAIYRRLYERTKEEMHELAGLGEEGLAAPPRPAMPSLTTRPI
jgi:xylulokinase